MSNRLQVLVPEELERRVKSAAQRSRQSTSAWVRTAIERRLADERVAGDPLDRLSGLGAPTGDMTEILAEIEAGRGR
jgi:predicted transcriptional regulator